MYIYLAIYIWVCSVCVCVLRNPNSRLHNSAYIININLWVIVFVKGKISFNSHYKANSFAIPTLLPISSNPTKTPTYPLTPHTLKTVVIIYCVQLNNLWRNLEAVWGTDTQNIYIYNNQHTLTIKKYILYIHISELSPRRNKAIWHIYTFDTVKSIKHRFRGELLRFFCRTLTNKQEL